MQKRPSYHKYYQKRKLSVLTYILGSRCKDGVVVVGDKKFTVDYGEHFVYGDKLFGDSSNNYLLGFSGDRGAFELFKTTFNDAVNNHYETVSDKLPVEKLILMTSDTISKVNNKFRNYDQFDAILGIANGRDKASLRYFYPDGRLETVDTVKTIGSGSPYGRVFLKTWHTELTMEQVAELGYFVIEYIEKLQLTHSVGTGEDKPSIWFLPDPGFASIKNKLTPQLLQRFEENANSRLLKHVDSISKIFPWKMPDTMYPSKS